MSGVPKIEIVESALFMNNPPIRKRRRRTASTETSIAEQLDLFSTVELPQSNEPSEENNETSDDAIAVQSTVTLDVNLQDQIDLIRSEILDDNYHSQIAESKYWDDTHHWSDDPSLSDDYQHFLGHYE